MRDIGVRIRQRRTRLGWTVQKLATLAGIDGGFLSKLETGKANGSWETYMKIAGAMGLSVDVLLVNRDNVEEAPRDWREIPVLDYHEAALWTVDSSVAQPGQHESIMTNLEYPQSTFALRLRDDSNAPQYQPDDIVVINPAKQPRFGRMILAANQDGDAIFAQYRDGGINERGEQVFELYPLNPVYAPMRSDRLKLTIVGTMVEHRRYIRS